MRILFISKKPKTANWSDSIVKLREDLNGLPELEVHSFEIDTGGLGVYFGNSKRLRPILEKEDFDLLFVHHVICAWPIRGVLKHFTGKKILALHEAEPVFGYSYLFKNIFRIPIKHWIRYPRFWNSIPLRYFDKIFVLNQRQELFKRHWKKYIQVNFLGVDHERFQPGAGEKIPMVGFFPFDPQQVEKGFGMVKESLKGYSIDIKKGGGIPFAEMPKKYQESGFLILPSAYETYSLVLLEAMASNIFVVATNSVGLVENLLKKYSKEELDSFGIIVSDFNATSIGKAIGAVETKIRNGVKPRTRALLESEDLSSVGTAKRVKRKFEEVINETD